MVCCNKCNSKTRVLITITDVKNKEIYRYRKCLNCGHRFYTTAKYVIVEEVEKEDSKSKFYKEMYSRKKDDSQ